MTAYIALFRGLNVGGHGLLRMPALRAIHEDAGCKDVRTYVQSGNIVFRADGSITTVRGKIEKAFLAAAGKSPTIFLRTANDWQKLIARNPFPEAAAAEPSKTFLCLADAPIDRGKIESFHLRIGSADSFQTFDDAIYLHAPNGAGQSKFVAGLERAAGTPLTSRNWRTVVAIDALANA